MTAQRARLAIVLGLTAAIHGCSPREASTAQTSPAPSATVAEALPAPTQPEAAEPSTPLESAAPAPSGSALAAQPSPSPGANLLSFASGALVRSWPRGSALEGSPVSPLLSAVWRSAPGQSGPFAFVFELPATASIERLAISVPGYGVVPPLQHAQFAVSTTSASAGFQDVGALEVSGTSYAPQQVALPSPVTARWVRLTLAAPQGTSAVFSGVSAGGTAAAETKADVSVAGVWLIDDRLKVPNDPLYSSSTALPQRPEEVLTQRYSVLHVLQRGNEVQLVECGGGGVSIWHGRSDGATIRLTGQNGSPGTATLDREGTTLVAVDDSNTFPFIALRLAHAPPCQTEPPIGNGKPVLVIGRGYPPGSTAPTPWYRGYRFVSVVAPLLPVEDLAHTDTAVIAAVCDATNVFSDWQKKALVDFVASGGKLLIHDSDACTKTDYGFLPYAFTTSDAGRTGARGQNLYLAQSDSFGSDESDRTHFIDTKAYVAGVQDLGDANIVETQDPHWCGQLFGTNRLHTGGFVQMYARYKKGLIVYDGLDGDDAANPENRRVLRFELDQPTQGTLPCAQAASGSFVIASSQNLPYATLRKQRLTIDLHVLANLGWKGDVSLSVAAPEGASFGASVSPSVVRLSGDAAPVRLTIDVPQAASAAAYRFVVTGTSGANSAHADVTLIGERGKSIAAQLAGTGRVAVYGIYFDFNSDRVRPDSDPVLREIAGALKANPAWKLTIEGHTDNVGGASYNLDLSARRARSVMEALVARFAIAPGRLSTAGFGATRPKSSNATEAGRSLNRRVELVRR